MLASVIIPLKVIDLVSVCVGIILSTVIINSAPPSGIFSPDEGAKIPDGGVSGTLHWLEELLSKRTLEV